MLDPEKVTTAEELRPSHSVDTTSYPTIFTTTPDAIRSINVMPSPGCFIVKSVTATSIAAAINFASIATIIRDIAINIDTEVKQEPLVASILKSSLGYPKHTTLARQIRDHMNWATESWTTLVVAMTKILGSYAGYPGCKVWNRCLAVTNIAYLTKA